MNIAIIGGGPAGLVAALAADRCGIDAVVFEQRESFRRIGGGILIHSNGLRVLNALGVLEAFEPKLRATQKLLLLLADGRVAGEVDYSGIAVPQNRCGVVLRHVLHEYLLDAAKAGGVDVRFGHRLESLRCDDADVELTFANGVAYHANVVIACDGIHSTTRSAAGIAGDRRAIGEAYLRTVADLPVSTSVIREIWGDDGRRFGICPLPENRTYIFCSVPQGSWDDIRTNQLTEWIDSWTPFGSEVINLLRAVPDWNLASYDELYEMRLARWARPPVFVAGDAAHAMTPNLGQGANSAMVDALVLIRILARTVAGSKSLEAAASEYEKLRRDFVTRIQSASHQMGMVASWRSPLARTIRNATLTATRRFAFLRRRTELLGAGYNPPENLYLEPF